jgi:CBS domain-containing protein
MSYPVENLIKNRPDPTSVDQHTSVEQALRLMFDNDFSQLPFIDHQEKPIGMVTYKSILRACHHINQVPAGMKIQEVYESISPTQTYRPEDDLFDLLDYLKNKSAALIVDSEGKLIGIVTSYDAMEYTRRRAEDMMLVEDIETTIKDLIIAAFTDTNGELDQTNLEAGIRLLSPSNQTLKSRYAKALNKYCQIQNHGTMPFDQRAMEESFHHLTQQEQPKKFDELTFYEYTELLLHQNQKDYFQGLFDRDPATVRNLFDDVRKTRNDLAHFREINSSQRDQLRYCVEWLNQAQVSFPVSWPVYTDGQTEDHPTIREKTTEYIVDQQISSATKIIPRDEMTDPGESKYEPLANYLRHQPGGTDRIEISFEQIENIIKGDLPASARRHRAWWANDAASHSHANSWLESGWRTAYVNMNAEKLVFLRIKERERAYIAFFSALLSELRSEATFPVKDISPDGANWIVIAELPQSTPKLAWVNYSFARGKQFRVELYIDTGDKVINKRSFDRLYEWKDDFESVLGKISWERIDDKRASRVAMYHAGYIEDDEETLRLLRRWAVKTMIQFYETIAEPAEQILLEQTGGTDL